MQCFRSAHNQLQHPGASQLQTFPCTSGTSGKLYINQHAQMLEKNKAACRLPVEHFDCLNQPACNCASCQDVSRLLRLLQAVPQVWRELYHPEHERMPRFAEVCWMVQMLLGS